VIGKSKAEWKQAIALLEHHLNATCGNG